MRDPFLRAEVAELVQKHGLSGDAREDLEVVIRRVVTQNALEDALTLSRAGDLATLRRSGRIDPSDATLQRCSPPLIGLALCVLPCDLA